MLLAPMLLPKTVPDTAEGSWAVSPHWKLVCNRLSHFSLLLHQLHVSSPKGALTRCHTSSPSNSMYKGFKGRPFPREIVQIPDMVRARWVNSLSAFCACFSLPLCHLPLSSLCPSPSS